MDFHIQAGEPFSASSCKRLNILDKKINQLFFFFYSTGSLLQHVGSLVMACGIYFPDQELDHQGSPKNKSVFSINMPIKFQLLLLFSLPVVSDSL